MHVSSLQLQSLKPITALPLRSLPKDSSGAESFTSNLRCSRPRAVCRRTLTCSSNMTSFALLVMVVIALELLLVLLLPYTHARLSAQDSDESESFSSQIRLHSRRRPELRFHSFEPFESQDSDLDARVLELEQNEMHQLLPHWAREDSEPEPEHLLPVQRLVRWLPLVHLPRHEHRSLSYGHSDKRVRLLKMVRMGAFALRSSRLRPQLPHAAAVVPVNPCRTL